MTHAFDRSRRGVTLALGPFFTLAVTSCATTEQRAQLFGGLGGAAAGAAIGALAGGDTKAILAGAAAGAVAGWALVKLTQYHAEKTRSSSEAARAYGYKPAQGTVVKLRSASASPENLNAGQSVTFDMDYALLSPGDDAVDVEETWVLKKDGEKISDVPAKSEPREPGGWRSKASIEVPEDAEKGTYVVVSRVQAGSSYDERESTFVVR